MHGQGGDVHRATQMTDTMYGLHHGSHIRIDDSAMTAPAWNRDGDLLEQVMGQSDRAYPTGLQREFPKGGILVLLPLSQVPRIVSDLEQP